MTYIVPDSFLEKLFSLQTDYERRSNTKLDKSLQPCAVSIYFGAKNIKERLLQIDFISKFLLALKDDLKPNLVFASEEEIHEHIKGLSIMIAVCLFIMSDIDESYSVRSGLNAILKQLLHEAMALKADNKLDRNTRGLCLLEAQQFANPHLTATSVNRTFKTKFTESEWQDFRTYLQTECSLLNEFVDNFPITNIMMPFFSKNLELAGYSTGYVLGDMFAKSTQMIGTRYTLTAAIGSGVYCVFRTSSALGGAMLVVPSLAGKLLDTYFGVSMAWVLGSIMEILGKGVGFGVGMPLDAGWKLLSHTTSTIHDAFQSGSRFPDITGFTLIDPHRVVDGIKLQLRDNESEPVLGCIDLPKEQQIFFEIQKEGVYFQIGEETALMPWNSTTIPDAQELYNKLVEKKLIIEDKKEEMTAYVSILDF